MKFNQIEKKNISLNESNKLNFVVAVGSMIELQSFGNFENVNSYLVESEKFSIYLNINCLAKFRKKNEIVIIFNFSQSQICE